MIKFLKFLSPVFKKIALKLDNVEPVVAIIEVPVSVIDVAEEIREVEPDPPQSKQLPKSKQSKPLKKKTEIIPYSIDPIRDVIDLMEFPFLALSKNRKSPIIYESPDGTQKIKISRHTGHFLASNL